MEFNKNQIEAINHFKGNCCVMASAGSGKTSVLTNRIANLINTYKVDPKNILAITFSVKARENMQNRLIDLIGEDLNKVTIETFHALGNKILKESKYKYYHNKIKFWQQKQFVNNIVVKILGLENNENDVPTNAILSFISYQKNNLLDYNDEIISISAMPYGINIMRRIYQEYEEMKRNEKLMDFDDMLINTYKLLTSNDSEREKYQDRYKFILVDEMQDTNLAQYEILRLLGKKHNNVFVVGDPLQCIYEWNLANNSYIIDFYNDWIDTKVIPLNINYRSTQDIVEISNKLVENTKETTHKNYCESIANASKYINPSFAYFSDEFEEASKIAEKIISLKPQEYNYSDFAILTRTNFQAQAIEEGLYKNNIPYEVIGGTMFYELKEIKDMISYLRLVQDINNDIAFKQIFNSPNRYLGTVFLDEVSTYAKRHNISLFNGMQMFPRSGEWRYKKGISELNNIILKIRKRKNYKVGDLINIIRKDLDYDKYILKEDVDGNIKSERIDNLDTLVDLANKYNTVDLFLKEVDGLLGFSKNSDIEDKVKVMTIHKSKGLEFPIVFIVGVNDGLLPHAKSNNINEERRLFYVGLTRAEKELYISSTMFYRDKDMEISDFIYDIFDEKDIKTD
ncbi:MAG: ATP-dependent helicase [Clostridium sp.]|uniref:ATP-dependent helicase n=1 Tax=Clostridium sp. TaxID=1506 RepID=UPI0025C4EE3A|nr:ATP-dependent helicase [Clostridium sp.]MCE5220105.1 ATP-dependent helicase [Clostridium sp.]